MPFATIVAGVDFSPESEIATHQALGIAERLGARLVLVHVGLVPAAPEGIPPSMEPTARTYRGVLLDRLESDRRRLDELRHRLAGHGVDVSVMVIDEFPDTGVAAAAHQLSADLIVVGTHGRTGFRRLLLGSVAEKTIRLAEQSVLVARPSPAEHGAYHRILVGTDFSPLGERALDRALELAAPGAEVHLIHCWTPPGPELGLDTLELTTLTATLRDELVHHHTTEAARLFAARSHFPVELRFQPLESSPAAGLDDLATRLLADLIVVGSHGRRGVRRLLLGSVAEATVRHAPCSVLVAR